jgi:hypothetical protein
MTCDKTGSKLCIQGYYPVEITSGNPFKRQFFIHVVTEHGTVSAKTTTVIRDVFKGKKKKKIFSGTGRKITYDLWDNAHRKISAWAQYFIILPNENLKTAS